MKSCFTFLIVLLSTFSFAQTTFPTSNAVWVNSFYGYEFIGEVPIRKYLVSEDMFVALDIDTVVDQHSYNKIIKNDSIYYGALREETGKVFFIPKDSIQEFLLYDFTAQKGDTLHQIYMEDPGGYPSIVDDLVVSYVDSILFEGVYRKQFFLDNDGYWIEGVGCQFGLFVFPYMMVSYWEAELTCMSIGEFTAYPEAGNTPCAKVSSVEDFEHVTAISVYPNPASNLISIEAVSLKEHQHILIYNGLGELVLKAEHKNGKVDVSKLTTGLYFMELEHQAGSRVKFIKE